MAGTVATADVKEWKSIAGISGADRITQIHIRNLLLAHDIESTMEGSLIYDVSVPPAKGEQAIKLLRMDALKNGYYVCFGRNDVVRAAERKALISHTSVSSALERPQFSRETALGSFLRCKEIAVLTAKYPAIIWISVHERQYLATPNTYSTGYDVEIELQKSLQNQDDGYRGRYQVYDGGNGVRFLGSNEWGMESRTNRVASQQYDD